MNAPISQGRKAGKTGALFQNVVAAILESHRLRYEPEYHTGWLSHYDKEIRTDFFVTTAVNFPDGLCIECRWQEASGSTEEKMDHLVTKIKNYYQRPAIVVCDGKSSVKSLGFLKGEVGGNLRGAFNLTEFMVFSHTLATGGALLAIREMFDIDQLLLEGFKR